MNVCWITRFPLVERDAKLYSDYAAVRLRTLIPAQAMREIGHTTRILSINNVLPIQDFSVPEGCQVAVFDQLYPFQNEQFDQVAAAMLDLIARFRHLGIKTAADIHDDHFHLPGRLDYFRRLAQLVDVVIANTRGMKCIVSEHTDRTIEVIGDPCEGPQGEPLYAPEARRGGRYGLLRRFLPWNDAPRLKLLWFGHPSNFPALYELMPQLGSIAKRLPMQMAVVSAQKSAVKESCAIFNHYHGRRCRMIFIPWSLENTWGALRECDLCVIPVDLSNKSKSGKSANRLIETLRAGRFAIASPLPAYQEFSESAWIGESIAQGIVWALGHPAEVVERIRAGQLAIEQNYFPGAIARHWERMMFRLTG